MSQVLLRVYNIDKLEEIVNPIIAQDTDVLNYVEFVKEELDKVGLSYVIVQYDIDTNKLYITFASKSDMNLYKIAFGDINWQIACYNKLIEIRD